MSKFLDLIIATQLSTSFAWMCALCAHLVDQYANTNWQFSVYVLLGISVIFMLAPYLIFNNPDNHNPFENAYIDEKGWIHDRKKWIEENCNNESN